ncbi:MAG TPA: SPOR domain-containing protein [Caulobacteraceae bacterium]|jgi:cell division protein FtsN|nr:SPOR domain-containing protein [Caulobacteraceae bacterium]
MADTDGRQYSGEPPLTLASRRAERARGPFPLTLIVSLVVLAAVAAGVFWLYRGGARSAGDAPQPVGAPLRDVRVAAPPQPKAEDPAAGLTIYKDDAGQPAAPTFAPPPEEPAARPGAPAAAPVAQKPASTTGGPSDQIGALLEKPDAAASKAQRVAQVDSKAGAKPAVKAKVVPSAAEVAPKAKAAAATPEASLSAPTSPAVATRPEVQIGAFSTKAQAEAAWSAAAAAAPGAMAGKGRRLTSVQRDGQTLYRVTITGAASAEAAGSLCRQLKASGHACLVR